MRSIFLVMLVIAVGVDCQLWKLPQKLLDNFTWLRQGKVKSDSKVVASASTTAIPLRNNTFVSTTLMPPTTKDSMTLRKSTASRQAMNSTKKNDSSTKSSPIWTTVHIVTQATTARKYNITNQISMSSISPTTEMITTDDDTTLQDVTETTEESRDNHRVHQYYVNKEEKPQVKIASNISQNLLPLPAGASAALVKPTKYHYYPHNQHIYLLPECAIQQVCNAVYVRLNWTQPLCACPSRYRDPCSASLNSDDQHTTELMIDRNSKRALTLVKTCEPTSEMRYCRAPRDWSLLALQNIRTGKSHYLVICRCSGANILEGPMSHDQPTYASVPGIRVYGMMCVQGNNNKRKSRPLRTARSLKNPPFPWAKLDKFSKTVLWI